MPKENKSKETEKESFFSKLAILLAPIDEKILYRSRQLKAKEVEQEKEPARRQCRYPEIRPMQVIKI